MNNASSRKTSSPSNPFGMYHNADYESDRTIDSGGRTHVAEWEQIPVTIAPKSQSERGGSR